VPARATASQPAAGPRPERLRIASIGVDTPLEDLALDADGTLHAPQDFQHAGWYAQGTSPGDVGPAVIAGHVDTKTGRAVFFRLRDLRQGDILEVTRAGAQVKFKVLAVRKYPKAQFPTDEVYGPTPNAQLRLITCGGAFDHNRRSYVDNIVVYAVAL
jgi:LPXTG-site transpeptidase (sortase) family protein